MPELAITVVSYETRELLCRCLASLEGEATSGRAEVWVVDNASRDGSAEAVRSSFPWVHLLEPGRNLGFGAAVNLVAARTATPWVVAANADVEVGAGALDRLLAAAAADPVAGAVAPRLVLTGGTTQHSVFAFPGVRFTVAFVLGLARGSLGDRLCVPGWWDADRARRVPWAIGAFLLIRREAWEAAGGFDERQWLYAEDLDLGWRLRRAGWATRYEPAAHVRHAESAATAAAFGDARTERWQRATYEWIERRRGAPVARLIAALNVAGAATRAALVPGRRRFYWGWAGLHARAGLRPRGSA